MKTRFTIAIIALLAICACSGSIPGTDYLLPQSQVERDTKAARSGDSEAAKRLAFHFSLAGNKALSRHYLSKCIMSLNADCLAEQSNIYYAIYIDRNTKSEDRPKYLSLAIEFNHRALIYVVPNNFEAIKRYQLQGLTLLNAAKFVPE